MNKQRITLFFCPIWDFYTSCGYLLGSDLKKALTGLKSSKELLTERFALFGAYFAYISVDPNAVVSITHCFNRKKWLTILPAPVAFLVMVININSLAAETFFFNILLNYIQCRSLTDVNVSESHSSMIYSCRIFQISNENIVQSSYFVKNYYFPYINNVLLEYIVNNYSLYIIYILFIIERLNLNYPAGWVWSGRSELSPYPRTKSLRLSNSLQYLPIHQEGWLYIDHWRLFTFGWFGTGEINSHPLCDHVRTSLWLAALAVILPPLRCPRIVGNALKGQRQQKKRRVLQCNSSKVRCGGLFIYGTNHVFLNCCISDCTSKVNSNF